MWRHPDQAGGAPFRASEPIRCALNPIMGPRYSHPREGGGKRNSKGPHRPFGERENRELIRERGLGAVHPFSPGYLFVLWQVPLRQIPGKTFIQGNIIHRAHMYGGIGLAIAISRSILHYGIDGSRTEGYLQLLRLMKIKGFPLSKTHRMYSVELSAHPSGLPARLSLSTHNMYTISR